MCRNELFPSLYGGRPPPRVGLAGHSLAFLHLISNNPSSSPPPLRLTLSSQPQPFFPKTLRLFPSLHLGSATVKPLTTTSPFRSPNATPTPVPRLTKTPSPWPTTLCYQCLALIQIMLVGAATVCYVITLTSPIIKQYLHRLLGSRFLTGDLLPPSRISTLPRSPMSRPPPEPPPSNSAYGLNGSTNSITPLQLGLAMAPLLFVRLVPILPPQSPHGLTVSS